MAFPICDLRRVKEPVIKIWKKIEYGCACCHGDDLLAAYRSTT